MLACLWTTLSVVGGWIRDHYHLSPKSVLNVFDVDAEPSVPTYFSCVVLLTCSVALAVTAFVIRSQGGTNHHWKVLSAGFLLMSVDEVAMLHERTARNIDALVKNIPHPAASWTVGGVIVVVGVFFYFLPFLRALPARTRWQFLISGAIFVGGAVGVEIPEGEYLARHGKDFVSDLFMAGEEMMEMGGSILFLSAVLQYLGTRCSALTIRPSSPS